MPCSLQEVPRAGMSRRRALAVFGAGVVFGCSRPHDLVVSPLGAQKRAIGAELPRRMIVYEAASISLARPATPLDALDAFRKSYRAEEMPAGPFVTAVSGVDGSWVFAVNGVLPDWFGGASMTRLGNALLRSDADMRQYLPRFRKGTLGLAFLDYDWLTIVQEGAALDPILPQDRPTAETVFSATPASPALFTWLRVGTLLPDLA